MSGLGNKNSRRNRKSKSLPLKNVEQQIKKQYPLTENEKRVRKEQPQTTSAVSKPFYKNAHDISSSVSNWHHAKYTYANNMTKTADADVLESTPNSFYSPQLSTDYLQLPKSIEERRSWYRFWYESNEIVARAVDLHSTLPLSKIKLNVPNGSDPDTNDYILNFYQRMCDRLNLFQRLLEISHEYWLMGDVFIFFEDGDGVEQYFKPDEDADEEDIFFDEEKIMYKRGADEDTGDADAGLGDSDDAGLGDLGGDTGGDAEEDKKKKPPTGPHPIPYMYPEKPIKQKPKTLKERLRDLKIKIRNPKYKGLERILILPPDDVRIEVFPFTDKVGIQLNLNPEARRVFDFRGEPFYSGNRNFVQNSEDIMNSVPKEIVDHLQEGGVLPLGTDPFEGSFVYHLARKKSQYEPLGSSILDRCQRTLLYLDKLRQSQTQIASRHMTPIRIAWGEDLSNEQTDDLRLQIEQVLEDPDYSVVANYEVHFEEFGARDRLLDLAGEMEIGQNLLFIGLGVTKELMTGEGTFSGNRVSLEIMNTLYVSFREIITNFIEEIIFKPIAVKKGFYELDKWGNKKYLYPKISFTRLSLRDNSETYEQLFNLYSKGSISIDLILELLGIDPLDSKKKVERDLFTVNDPLFNELVRAIYQEVGSKLTETTDITDRLAKYLSLNFAASDEDEEAASSGTFGGI